MEEKNDSEPDLPQDEAGEDAGPDSSEAAEEWQQNTYGGLDETGSAWKVLFVASVVTMLLVFLLSSVVLYAPIDEVKEDIIGGKAPDFTLEGDWGTKYSISNYAGLLPVLLEFVEIEDPGSLEMTETLSRLEKKVGLELIFISIVLDEGYSAADIDNFSKASGATWPILRGNDTVSKDYKVEVIPTTFLIAWNGTVVERIEGNKSLEELEGSLEKIKHAGPKIGRYLGDIPPDFVLQDVYGDPHRLYDYLGEGPILLEFMSTSCPFCLNFAQVLGKIHEKYQENLTILSVTSPINTYMSILDFKDMYDVNWTLLLGSREVSAAFEIENTPSTYMIDTNGTLAWGFMGWKDYDAVANAIDIVIQAT